MFGKNISLFRRRLVTVNPDNYEWRKGRYGHNESFNKETGKRFVDEPQYTVPLLQFLHNELLKRFQKFRGRLTR